MSIMGDDGRILIVCTGNICRSPFIERLLQRQLDERRPGSDRGILVHSAGTGALTGSAMDERAAALLVAYGGTPWGSGRETSPLPSSPSPIWFSPPLVPTVAWWR
jgi:protein-tyrosine phosphatase